MKTLLPHMANNLTIYEQIILEEEEIHNLEELDTKLNEISKYKPSISLKIIKFIIKYYLEIASTSALGLVTYDAISHRNDSNYNFITDGWKWKALSIAGLIIAPSMIKAYGNRILTHLIKIQLMAILRQDNSEENKEKIEEILKLLEQYGNKCKQDKELSNAIENVLDAAEKTFKG